VRRRYRFVVAGYVVVPVHVHLLIGEPVKGAVSGVIHALKLSVAMRRVARGGFYKRGCGPLISPEGSP
jgi:putative transposase